MPEMQRQSFLAFTPAPNSKLSSFLEHPLPDVREQACGLVSPYVGTPPNSSVQTHPDRSTKPSGYTKRSDHCRRGSDRVGEGRAYGNLGIVYNSRGQLGKAVEFHKDTSDNCSGVN